MKDDTPTPLPYNLEFIDEHSDIEVVINIPLPEDYDYFDKMLKLARRGRFKTLGDVYGWRYGE